MAIDKNLLWNYLGYGISFGVNILLLPMILNYLGEEELGLWYAFLSVGTFVTMVDFGFSPQIARFVTYAYAGTDALQKEGVSSITKEEPNVLLLYKLLFASRKLYLYLGILVLLLLLSAGTFYIYTISKTLPIVSVMVSWLLFCIATFVNIVYCYYGAFYRGIGNFVDINRALLISKSVQIICSLIGLYCGYGMIALALSFLLSGITLRVYFVVKFKTFKLHHPLPQSKVDFSYNVFGIIWHNSWREGVIMLSRFLIIQANTILCSLYLGLSDTAAYALAVQILAIISSLSLINLATKLPTLNMLQAKHDIERRSLLLSNLWFLFIISFFVLLLLLYVIGMPIIEYIKPNVMLNKYLLLFVSIYVFLEANQSFFASYISTSNELPYVFPYLYSALVGVLFAIILLEFTDWGVWGIVLAHFLVQLSYNNWKWPKYAIKHSYTNINHFLASGIKK